MIIGNGNLITHNAASPFIQNGAVVISGRLIQDFGNTKAMKEKYPEKEFIDAKGKVIMPGLINAHSHIYSALCRGLTIKNSPASKNFNDILENLWWKLDDALNMEDVTYSAYTTLIDSIKNGVTTLFDHHASFSAIEGSLFAIADVAKALGIRASLCYEVSDRGGKDKTLASIKENMDFIDYAAKNPSDMLKGMFGLHASMTLSDETLNLCQEKMAGCSDTGFHVHTAEGISDVHDALKRSGKRVIHRLFDFGILGEKSLAIHCVHINKAEIELLVETNTAAVHNPQSNMGNAVGCSPVLQMLEAGVIMGMGTDAYTNDMFESLKTENIIQKHNACDPGVAWGEPPAMLFENNRKICARFFDTPVGLIDKNAAADIVIIDYNPHTPMDESNTNSHIHFGILGKQVTHTMVNGKFLMKDRILTTVDEEAIMAKSREVTQKLWNRING